LRPAILRRSRTLKQQMLRFAGPNASQPSQRISHVLRRDFSHFETLGRLLSRILRCLGFLTSTVSKLQKCLVSERHRDPHHLKAVKSAERFEMRPQSWAENASLRVEKLAVPHLDHLKSENHASFRATS
jgi:hypothetical protein